MARRNLTFEEAEPELRRLWEATRPDEVLDWLEIRDAYRFGWRMALLPEYCSLAWEEAEADLAQHWYNPQAATEETTWEYVKSAVREGWHQRRRYAS